MTVLLCWAPFSSAATIRVPAGSDLQVALDSANSGDTLVLDAGATYIGNFVLRNRGNLEHITIISSQEALLPRDRRVTPAAVVYMPTIITPNNLPAIATALGA